ncbi:MAG: Gldg family protein [Hyphomicrobiaceae bacterium]|nr:Gldg family protein [Hyphomicrobiaceae bacterium]
MAPRRVLARGLAVMRNEWRQLAYSRVTALFQAGFLVALAIATFLVGRVYQTDVANLAMQWTFLPWVAIVLAPAFAMTAFADTPGDRSLELTSSLPLPSMTIVAGTWLAGTLVLWLTLAMTAPFALTIAYLGDLDWGAALAGYIGAAGFMAVSFAVAIFAAAWARDAIGGYVSGLVLLVVLQLLGTDAATGLLRGTVFSSLLAYLPLVSPRHWLSAMSTGRVEMAGLVYFVLMTCAALWAATIMIERRRYQGAQRGAAAWLVGGAVVVVGSAALLAMVTLATRLDAGLDFTAEREFTLHPETRDVARRADPRTRIDLFWSGPRPDIPVAIRTHAERARNLLRRFASQSSGRVKVIEHAVEPDTEEEDRAASLGVQSIALSEGGNFVLGAVFEAGDRRVVIPYFNPDRASVLEYDVASTVSAMARKAPAKIGIVSSLLSPRNTSVPREGLSILEELKRQYDVAIIPHFADALPDGLDALIVFDATILKPSMLYAIDQHVMAGRGLIAMMDPFVRFNTGSNVAVEEPGEEINDLSDVIARYGVRFLSADVIGDPALASTVGAGDQRFQYPFWLRVRRENLSSANQATAGLNELAFAEPGALDITGVVGAEALVQTTARAGAVSRSEFKDANPQELAARIAPGGGSRVLMAALTGPYKSAFTELPSGAKPSAPHTESQKSARVFVVADVDWLFDPLTVQSVAMEGRQVARPLNDNIAALLNLAEAATGGAGLTGIRSRGRLNRPFTRVSALLDTARERYRETEANLLARIARVETNVRKVLEVSGARSVSELPEEIQGKVAELRRALLPYRRELRALRQTMREEVERLGWWLAVLNLLAGPLLVAMFATAMRLWRRRSFARIATSPATSI